MKISNYQKYRLLEIFPGTMVWLTLLLTFLLSFFKPLWMIYFAIAFDLYWLLRVLYFIIYLTYSWKQYRKIKNVPWMTKVVELPDWQKIYHVIFLPTLNEDAAVIKHTFAALKNSTYPLDKMIVVLAGEEREAESFKKIAEEIRVLYEGVFFKLFITLHPQDVTGEIAAKGANLHWAAKHVKEFIDAQKWDYANIIVSSFDIDDSDIVRRQPKMA